MLVTQALLLILHFAYSRVHSEGMTLQQQLDALQAAERKEKARKDSDDGEDSEDDDNDLMSDKIGGVKKANRDISKQVIEAPRAESLSAALQQAVRSNDLSLLDLCLQEGERWMPLPCSLELNASWSDCIIRRS